LKYLAIILFVFILVFFSCSLEQEKNTKTPNTTLLSHYKFYFPIGIGIHKSDIILDSVNLITSHFSSISSASGFKFDHIQPHNKEFNFTNADIIYAFAQKNNLKLHGHTLIWGNRNPYWLFWDAKGNLVNRKLLDQRLKNHITTVVRRYNKIIHLWDVINEAVYDNNKEWLKNNTWYKIFGEEYIYKAFQYTHEADSNALLFYNDYDAEQPSKRDRIVKLIKQMKDKNIPIHGIGIQGHWTTENLNLSDLESAINIYSSMGLQVQITELHITKPEDPNATDDLTMEDLASIYHDLFLVLLKHKHQITGVTFWQSENTKNRYYPLFDSLLKPTIVYQSIVNANSSN
jgi:endo-1,4-beta-xylanase